VSHGLTVEFLALGALGAVAPQWRELTAPRLAAAPID